MSSWLGRRRSSMMTSERNSKKVPSSSKKSPPSKKPVNSSWKNGNTTSESSISINGSRKICNLLPGARPVCQGTKRINKMMRMMSRWIWISQMASVFWLVRRNILFTVGIWRSCLSRNRRIIWLWASKSLRKKIYPDDPKNGNLTIKWHSKITPVCNVMWIWFSVQ